MLRSVAASVGAPGAGLFVVANLREPAAAPKIVKELKALNACCDNAH
jgi:hypothetical protein